MSMITRFARDQRNSLVRRNRRTTRILEHGCTPEAGQRAASSLASPGPAAVFFDFCRWTQATIRRLSR